MNKKLTNILVAGVVATSVTQSAIACYNTNEFKEKQIVLQHKYNEAQLNLDKLNKQHKEEIKNKDKQIDKIKRENESLQKENKELKECPTQDLKHTPNKKQNQDNSGEPVQMTLTYYGDFAEENGGYTGIDAQGNRLQDGTVASNVYDFGTEFVLNGKVYTVNDRGGGNFDSPNRLDVFVERENGEDDEHYEKRISDLGKDTVTMYMR